MRISSLLAIFDTLLETVIVARAQFLLSRAYGDVDGMVGAIEVSLTVDQDLVSILEDAPFQPVELSGLPRLPGTPEEIVELMRKLKRIQTASVSDLLKTIPGEIPELEERRAEIADHKMNAVGNFFRTARRVLREQFDSWNASLEREFEKMLKLRAPRRKH